MKKVFEPNFFPIFLQRENMFSIEGIDGAGKTTQAHALEKALLLNGYKASYATNPSKTAIGIFLRKNLNILPSWQKISLFVLDIINVLSFHKDSDKILIWDRYTHSTLISNKDVSPSQIVPILQFLPKPKITFFLDIDPKTVLENRSSSVHDHSADINWQKLKYARYMKILKTNPSEFYVIDGTLPQDQITKIMLNAILDKIKKNINTAN